MATQVKINPEIARLAHRRVSAIRTSLNEELARMVVEETVVNLNPTDGWLMDLSKSFSDDDTLVQSLGVNDVVINGCHIDVRALDEQGCVSITSALVGTSYLSAGSLVVQVEGTAEGAVVGYVSPNQWGEAALTASNGACVNYRFTNVPEVDLSSILQNATNLARTFVNIEIFSMPSNDELSRFVAARHELTLARQQEIVEQILAMPEVRLRLKQAVDLWSDSTLARILCACAAWESRIDRLSDKLQTKFPKLDRAVIRAVALKTGEMYGGQIESPAFRKTLLALLTKEELASRMPGLDTTKLSRVVEHVLSGQTVVEAAQEFVKNRMAVDLALAIRHGRAKLEGFVAATAEEIGMAFQQLSLKPAYATHSKNSCAGIESINEALAALEAGELAQSIKELESELVIV
ncbi:MAG: hypothetical protein HY711_11465 [Candidatus Melainabacteria bacterium]|nr:hypothetical protein [Candidatus Melainabacteria bacterium]